MTYLEFKRHVGKAGLSIDDFSSLLGVRPASVSNYSKKGRVPTPYAVIAVLLGDAADQGTDPIKVLARYGVRTKGAGSLSRLEHYRANKNSRQS